MSVKHRMDKPQGVSRFEGLTPRMALAMNAIQYHCYASDPNQRCHCTAAKLQVTGIRCDAPGAE
jgi:hypothetical protein